MSWLYELTGPCYLPGSDNPPAKIVEETATLLPIKHQIQSFSRPLAKEYGVNAAILVGYLANRIKAVEEKRNDSRGFFITISDLAKHYPYLCPSTIADTLTALREKGVLNAENHNKKKYDRTLWYSFGNSEVQRNAFTDPIRFSVQDAVEYGGVVEAVLLANIIYWVMENRKTKPDYIWHRISSHTLSCHLPFSQRTICRALNKLVKSGAVELRKCHGFDQASEYRVLDNSRLDKQAHEPKSCMHEPMVEMGKPKPEMHEPVSELHESKPEMHEPIPDDYTILKDTVRKTPLERPFSEARICENTYINPSAAPPGVCVCSKPQIPETGGKDQQREVTSPCYLPIDGSASDSQVNRQEHPKGPDNEDTSASGSLAVPVTLEMARQFLKQPPLNSSGPKERIGHSVSSAPDGLPAYAPKLSASVPGVASCPVTANINLGLRPVTSPTRGPIGTKENSQSPFAQLPARLKCTAQDRAIYEEKIRIRKEEERNKIEFQKRQKAAEQMRWAEYDELYQKYASQYAGKECDKRLSAEEKVRVLKAAINSRLKTGAWDNTGKRQYSVQLYYDKKGLALAQKFFELNPKLEVFYVLALMDECCRIACENKEPDGGYDMWFYERKSRNLSFFIKHLQTLSTKLDWVQMPVEVVYLDEVEETEKRSADNPTRDKHYLTDINAHGKVAA